MLIRQSKNTYIRIYDDGSLGYITNQLTRHDRTYDEAGADFLTCITRQPQRVDDVVERLCALYSDADKETLQRDFMEFAEDLADHKFLVLGETEAELNARDLDFSYSMENPKTLADDFTQPTGEKSASGRTTQDYLLQHDAATPRLAGLQFELTSRCNERCIHCYIPNGKKNHGFDMPMSRFRDIVDQYADMGGIAVTLSGGEALMNKHIIEMLRYCREKDLQISLLTNLISMREEHVAAMKETNVSLVQVSLYSMDAAKHDQITTVRGSFEKTKAAIERLYAADVPVQISCPVMKANREGYDEVMAYARSMRMKSNTDYVMMAQADLDTSNLANRLTVEETERVIRYILDTDSDYTGTTLEQEPLTSIPIEEYAEMPLCGAGINDLCVTVNGDVYPCAGWQAYVVGNVFRQSLRDIWEHSPQLAAVRRVKQKDFPKCLTCEARDYCNMCLVRNYNESGGDMFHINQHFCDVAFLTKRLVEEWRTAHAEA